MEKQILPITNRIGVNQPQRPADSQTSGVATPALEDLQKEVIDERRFVTNRISETTRYLGFGLLAIFYGIISSADAYAQQLKLGHPLLLQLMALSAMLALILDHLQYLFGRAAARKALKRTDKPYTYNKQWSSMRGRWACFWGKQAMALLGCLIFLWVVVAGL